jgi:Rrf2 family protein
VKLSSKGRYGVRALFDIAFFNSGRPTQVKDIAERQGIPPRFLEQIFQDLKRARIVSSKRGPQGGYSLARKAEEIRLGDVVRALEGPVVLADPDAANSAELPAPAADESGRITDVVLGEVAERIEACFDAVSIADVCARADSMGVRRTQRKGYVYVI